MHAVSFSGDLKDYLLKLDLLRRKLNSAILYYHTPRYCTLLKMRACIHAHQMEIKQADKAANKNFDTFLNEMRATAQDLATYTKSTSSAKVFAATAITPSVDCSYCKRSGHTLEKCKAMLASQKAYTESQAQRRKDNAGASQSTARPAISNSSDRTCTSASHIDRSLYDKFIAFKAFSAISDTRRSFTQPKDASPTSTTSASSIDRNIYDEFVSFKAFSAISDTRQPPDEYSDVYTSATPTSNSRAFMASVKSVNHGFNIGDRTVSDPVTNYISKVPMSSPPVNDRFITAASSARVLLPSEITGQPDYASNMCGYNQIPG